MAARSLGFSEVYDYVDSKLDWLAAGLPTEVTSAELPREDDVVRNDVPTCRVDEPIAEVRERVRAAGWDACVVVNEKRVVFGLLREPELDAAGDASAENSMRPGPSTFRPHVPIEEMAAFMQQHDLASSPITSSDGRLIGLLRRRMPCASHTTSTSASPSRPMRGAHDDSWGDDPGDPHLHELRCGN